MGRWQPLPLSSWPWVWGLATRLLREVSGWPGKAWGLRAHSRGKQQLNWRPGAGSSRRVPPSHPPPRCAPTLRQPSSHPEQSSPLCPLGPPRAWRSPSRSAIGQGCAPPPRITHPLPCPVQAFVGRECSPGGVRLRLVPEDAPHAPYAVLGSWGHTVGPYWVPLLVCCPPVPLLPELGLQGCLELCACLTP